MRKKPYWFETAKTDESIANIGGIYELGVKVGHENIVSVYVGQADILGERMGKYQSCLSDRAYHLSTVLSEGHSVYYRYVKLESEKYADIFRIHLEDCILRTYDYPWNEQLNTKARQPNFE